MSHDPTFAPPSSPADIRPQAALVGAALEQLTEGVILADPSGRITFVNDAAARLHGVVRLDVTPADYADRYHLLTEDGHPYPSTELPLARAVLRGDTIVDARWRIRRPDGSEIVAIGSARRVLGTGGENLGAVLTLRDDTPRVETERANALAQIATKRLGFLSEASERLAMSLDYETTLREIVALAVPAVADWAHYTIDNGDGTLRIVALRHVDPVKERSLSALAERYPIGAEEPAGAARVLRTGEPELIEQIPDTLLEAVARDAEHLALLRAVGFRSLMTVPVTVQGAVIGVLGFVTGTSGRTFDADDLALAGEIARRAAVAIDHARLFADAETARREAEAQRERAAGVLETMADAHFVLDSQFRFVSVNAASERNLERTREQLLGKLVWDEFPSAVGSIFEESYRRVVNERVELHFSGPYTDATIDIVPEVDAYPTMDGGVAVFWRDISARLRAEAELRASEQRLRDIFEQAPLAVAVMTGPEHVYTAVSPMYAKTPGLGRQLIGLSMRDAFPEVADSGYIEAMDAVYHTGVPYNATERLVPLMRVDGTMEDRFYNIGYQPLRDMKGDVYAVASVAYDVTDQVLARREVEAAREEAERQRIAAEQANAAKSDFLSTMSHELRTPLNAIAGYTQLLTLGLRGTLSDQQLLDVARIGLASNHLMALVTDVLNFARLESGHVEYQIEDMDIAPVLAELEPLLGPQLSAKHLSFDHDGCVPDAAGEVHRVMADAEKLRQILLNLLTNAIKFTDDGGRIALSCENDEAAGVSRVHVSDTGRGIPSDQLERIFEPFVQVDRHRTPGSQQGVGLGLAISRDLARGMGGDLTVTSTVGVGSTLTLSLPRA